MALCKSIIPYPKCSSQPGRATESFGLASLFTSFVRRLAASILSTSTYVRDVGRDAFDSKGLTMSS